MKTDRLVLICILIFEIGVILFYGMPIVFQTPSFVLEIKSDSMSPVLKTGDYVLVDGRDYPEIGDIIAFYDSSSGDIVVHRIVDESGNCFITKGDNSLMEDFFNPCPSYVLGIVRG